MSNITGPVKRDFYAIVANKSADKVLLLEDNNQWVLPHWQAQRASSVGDFVPWVNRTLRELYGLDTLVLKEYYFQRIFENNQFHATHRVVAVELREGAKSSVSVEKASWVGLENIAGASWKFAVKLHAELVEKWLRENSTDRAQILPRRMPWARPGWFEKATEWVTGFIQTQGWQLTGPIEQRRANVISAQLLISTSVGNLYLKAVPPYFKNEPIFGLVLEKLLPAKVPHILHTEAAEGWILMSDFGGKSLAEIKDFSVWEEALREYARLQITCIEHTEELSQVGVDQRSLSSLSEHLEKVLRRDDLWLMGQPMGLSQEEVSQLQAAIPILQRMCLELAAFGLPQTLDSGDFHADNVALTSNGFVFYDWSDLSITHPFVSLNPFKEYSESFKDKSDYWEKLTKAYLEPWLDFLPQPELDQAYRLAYVLGSAMQVLNYAWIHDNLDAEDYHSIDMSIIYCAKMLLEALEKY